MDVYIQIINRAKELNESLRLDRDELWNLPGKNQHVKEVLWKEISKVQTIKPMSEEIVSELQQRIRHITAQIHKFEQRKKLIDDCKLKTDIEQNHLPKYESYKEELTALLQEILQYDEKRGMVFDEFIVNQPDVLKPRNIERFKGTIGGNDEDAKMITYFDGRSKDEWRIMSGHVRH